MRKYIFITPDGLTYKPNYDGPEPDFLDLQVIGYGHSASLNDALQDLIEINGNLFENKQAPTFSIRMETHNNNSLWCKAGKTKTPIAS